MAHRLGVSRVVLALTLVAGPLLGVVRGQLRLADHSDRAAFRSWFVFLADTQFYRQTSDVDDCAALVRHAFREALRPHTPEWVRTAELPLAPAYPDVTRGPKGGAQGWPLFRISADPSANLAEFADARTIVNYNASLVSREARAARPGDLLYFRQPHQGSPDHLMVFVGRSVFEPDHDDWIVYHTGPSGTTAHELLEAPDPSIDPGEVRKVRLADLLHHPSPHWRPVPDNPNFVGIFTLRIL